MNATVTFFSQLAHRSQPQKQFNVTIQVGVLQREVGAPGSRVPPSPSGVAFVPGRHFSFSRAPVRARSGKKKKIAYQVGSPLAPPPPRVQYHKVSYATSYPRGHMHGCGIVVVLNLG